ncbi:hypothetical protein ACLI4U_17880 [Natrialbaceae archaeon A-CW2]|uniref:Uncharacterized protein n=1 Tax=Natronosalvus hydrolyticus TaxID=2979988 RepID=A0AAP2Z9Y8_9EURY|nr:hypothetical protein [Natronosalvus amylolyticus]MCU4753407.1 hypothetical protein [Halobacteria archaeon AArc-curdl1]
MRCDNCQEHGGRAYVLKTYVERGGEQTIDLEFCSATCLREWT